jgi:hypothetical protein
MNKRESSPQLLSHYLRFWLSGPKEINKASLDKIMAIS